MSEQTINPGDQAAAEQFDADAAMKAQQMLEPGFEYSDIDQDSIDQADATSARIEGRIDELHEESPSFQRNIGYSNSPEEWGRKFENSDDLANLDRVDKMYREAHRENNAHDIVASEGVVTPDDTYQEGSNTLANAPVENDMQRRTYDTGGSNGEARVVRTERWATPNSPRTEHVFAPKNQKRAKELIQSLADKQGERAAARRREINVENAEKVIQDQNKPKAETDKAA